MVQGENRCLWEIILDDPESVDPLFGVRGVCVGMRSCGSKKYSTFSLPVICC